jgi:NUMOD1 domain
MVFKRPITVYNNYRLVPGYTNFAVSPNGQVINAHTLKKVATIRKSDYYTDVLIYDPLKNKERNVKVHRLVALAWVKNPDNRKFYLVNHINGIKSDNRKENLEWVDYTGNIRHAFDNGLRTDNIPCRVRNVYTKEVTDFSSVSQAAVFMGVGGARSAGHKERLVNRLKSRLINGQFEFRLGNDDTPWFYEDKDGPVEPSRYILNVVEEDGTPMTFHGIRDFIKYYKLWNMSSTSVEMALKRMSEVRPGVVINVIDNYVVKPFQAKNVQTGEVFEEEHSRELAAKLGVCRKTIISLVKANSNRVCKGYLFRYKTDEPWRDDFVETGPTSWCITAKHTETGDLLEFDSLRKAAKHFDVDRLTIQRAVKANRPIGAWLFERKVN